MSNSGQYPIQYPVDNTGQYPVQYSTNNIGQYPTQYPMVPPENKSDYGPLFYGYIINPDQARALEGLPFGNHSGYHPSMTARP